MAFLSLLLHPLQNLVRLLAGRLVHAGLLDLFLEATHIRDILRMHFIELLLQKINLLLQRILPVELLIRLLRCVLRLTGDIGLRDKAVDGLLNHVEALRFLVHLEKMEAFLRIQTQIGGQRCSSLLEALPAVDVLPRHQPPRELLQKFKQSSLHGVEALVHLLFRNILDILAQDGRHIDLLAADLDLSEIHPSQCFDRHISIRINRLNSA